MPLNNSPLKLFKILGPGVVFAGTAIGGSHLVQSTRAGAKYGFALIGLVVFINLLKYPFFEIGRRYKIASGKNLLEGYQQIGPKTLWLFLVLSIVLSFPTLAAVSFVTSNILAYILGDKLNPQVCGILLSIIYLGILGIGHYRLLDAFIKWLMLLLSIATIISTGIALWHYHPMISLPSLSPWQISELGFLLALMGWMPAPIDSSAWISLWGEAKASIRDTKPTLREVLLDFNVGYFIIILLAVCFVTLGATVMHTAGKQFPTSGVAFIHEFISLFTAQLGSWCLPLIAFAAFTTMFSTSLTCFDAYSRVLSAGLALIRHFSANGQARLYYIWLTFSILVSLAITTFFIGNMKGLVDLATTLAFLSSPVFAFFNFKLMRDPKLDPTMRPSKYLIILAYAGLLFYTITSIIFIIKWLYP